MRPADLRAEQSSGFGDHEEVRHVAATRESGEVAVEDLDERVTALLLRGTRVTARWPRSYARASARPAMTAPSGSKMAFRTPMSSRVRAERAHLTFVLLVHERLGAVAVEVVVERLPPCLPTVGDVFGLADGRDPRERRLELRKRLVGVGA